MIKTQKYTVGMAIYLTGASSPVWSCISLCLAMLSEKKKGAMRTVIPGNKSRLLYLSSMVPSGDGYENVLEVLAV